LEDFSLLSCIHALRDEAGEIITPETDPSVAMNYTRYLTIREK
jgi:hypothetical protein